MMNCKRCGFQLEDTDIICPVCGSEVNDKTSEMQIDESSEIETGNETETDEIKSCVDDEEVSRKGSERKEVISLRDIGTHSQVEITFDDGSTICLRKTVAKRLYPGLPT